MKLKGWVVAAAVAGGVVVASRGCLNQKTPDEKLADHYAELCVVAHDNVDRPVRGVDELGKFFAANAPAMMSELAGTVVLIEKISDDKKHDDRARLARDRIHAPLIHCARDLQRFAQAIDSNPEAKEKLDRALARLNRTFEILFGNKSVDVNALLANALAVE